MASIATTASVASRFSALVENQCLRNEDAHAALDGIGTAAKGIIGSRVATEELAALGAVPLDLSSELDVLLGKASLSRAEDITCAVLYAPVAA